MIHVLVSRRKEEEKGWAEGGRIEGKERKRRKR